MTKAFTLLFSLVLFFPSLVYSQTKSENQTIKVSCSVQSSPPKIIFNWPADANASYYIISKKDINASSWGPAYANIPDTSTYFIDEQVEIGTSYEYKFYKNTGIGNIPGYSYMFVGIEVAAVEKKGSVLLLVDSNYVDDLNMEISRLKMDLIGDGWRVISRVISRGTSVSAIRDSIIADKNHDPTLSTVFLLGHIPVPYSGNFNPDAHSNHVGAWPADLYYGEIDGNWTDVSINNTSASRSANHNVAGDGKFDQTIIPSLIDLEVGRVDLYNLPAFTASDLELTRQYLNKDHDFRHKILTAEARGLVDDNFKSFDEAFAQTAWRYFSGMFGASHVTALDFMSTLSTDSYLWAYGCGGGSYTSCGGIGNTADFAGATNKAIFTSLFGSYFGDWDSENNFLRAPLATPSSPLVCFWSGRPHWHLHHMDLGKHIGYSAKLTQNNNNLYTAGYAARGVHVALMGDPTLGMHIVEPPSSLQADSVGNVTVQLNWTASTDPEIIGYEVFRSTALNGSFEKINKNPVMGNSYLDDASEDGKNVYMLRALKLQTSGSGSFYNLSQGIFDSASTAWPLSVASSIEDAMVSAYPNPTKNVLNLHLKTNDSEIIQVSLYSSIGQEIFSSRLEGVQQERKMQIQLAEYGRGIYILQIQSKQGISERKIIVK
ncbi:MAG: T9SS type A sorting domain-containing protein [Bacteroidetes bacterium]|nr:T9SS type A sorting domain-containing protein [Bacteroidota bacterium]